jgi:hypothetical protein
MSLLMTWLLLGANALAATPWVDHRTPRKSVTLDFVYEACSNVGQTAYGRIQNFDCESYVYGVLDTYLAMRPHVPVSQRACFPEDLPPWRALEVTWPLLQSPASEKEAGPEIIKALTKAYPCKY